MDKEVFKLLDEIKSDDWKITLAAADRLADIGTEESVQPLLDNLKSEDNFKRNVAALGLIRTKNQKYFHRLLNRINELGPNEEIGTLVFALESFDCSKNLQDIVNLYLKGNFEVKQSTTNILKNQKFKVTKMELQKISDLLKELDYSLDKFDITYEIIG